MQPKLITSFNRLNEADFQSRVSLIVASMTNNPRFPGPLPAPAPGIERIVAANDVYLAAILASQTGDSVRMAERNAARDVLTGLLQHLAAYLEFAGHGDAAALLSTGFELRHEPVKLSRTEPLPAPEGLHVKHGAFSGQVDVRVSRVAGAGSYEVQVAVGDPTVEANWHQVLISTTCSHMLLSELTPLQTIWVRVRGIIAQSAGHWSAPVSIVVL